MAEVNGFKYSLYSIASGNPNGFKEGDSLSLNIGWVTISSEEYHAIELGDWSDYYEEVIPAQQAWIKANTPVLMKFDISKRYLKGDWLNYNDIKWSGGWQDVGTASFSYPASAWAPFTNEFGGIQVDNRAYYYRSEDIPEDPKFKLEPDGDPRDYIVKVQIRGGDFSSYEDVETREIASWGGRDTFYAWVFNTEALPQPEDRSEDDDLFGGLVFPPEGSLVSYLTTPKKYNRKKATKFQDFNPSSDVIQVDSGAFAIDDDLLTFKAVKGKRKLKKAAKKDFDFIFEKKKGFLYYNENGSDSGFGDGGLVAVINANTKLFAENFELV